MVGGLLIKASVLTIDPAQFVLWKIFFPQFLSVSAKHRTEYINACIRHTV